MTQLYGFRCSKKKWAYFEIIKKKKKIFFDKFTQIKVLKVTLQPIVFFVFSEPVKSKKITESVNLT